MSVTNVPIIGKGVTLTITPASGTAIVVQKVNTIKLPTVTYKEVETTGMSDAAEDFIPGFPNGGECEITATYMSTQKQSLYALKGVVGTTVAIARTDGTTATFTGFITSFGDEIPLKEKAVISFKFRATTIYTEASSS